MNVSLYIARRLRFRPDDRNATSPGIIIATAGIALALIIMLFAIAVVTGFKNEISEKVTGFNSQMLLTPAQAGVGEEMDDTTAFLSLDDPTLGMLRTYLPGDATVSLTLQRPVIIKTDDNFDGIVLKSMPPGPGFIAAHIVSDNHDEDAGILPDTIASGNELVISKATADKLSLSPGDRMFTYFFVDGNIKARRMTVSAIYDTHFAEFDSHLAFCDISFLQALEHIGGDMGSAIEINGIPSEADIDDLTSSIQAAVIKRAATEGTPILNVTNVHRTGALYFNWLSLLDTNVTVILILMACVAGFTLVSSTFIIILERVRMIGILKTLGMDNAAIRRIFIYMGERLVVRGLLAGNMAGLGLLMMQKYLKIIPLDPEAYYLDYVPVDIDLLTILALNAGVILISSLMLLLPTGSISSMSPARIVQFE